MSSIIKVRPVRKKSVRAATLMQGFVLCLFFAPAFFDSARADQIIYVNQNAPGGSLQTGTNWANAYRELRDAITVAQPSATNPVQIWIARGTYKPTDGADRAASFQLKSHLRLIGGFSGSESNPDARNIGVNPTVLSGDIGVQQSATTRVISAGFYTTDIPFAPEDTGFQDNSYNVLTLLDKQDVVLNGLIIANGNANLGNSSITLIDTNLTSSYIEGMRLPGETKTNMVGETQTPLDRRVAGGGLFIMNSHERSPTNITLTIEQCLFLNNGARGYGGGLAAREAQVLVNASLFRNNHAVEEGGAYWGFNHEGHFLNTEFTGNSAGLAGGAVSMQSIPNDRLFAPVVGIDGYVVPGLDKKHFMASLNMSLSLTKFSWGVASGTSIFHKMYNIANKLYNMLPGKTPPSVPSAPAAPTSTFSAQNMVRGVMAAYAALQIITAVTDIATKDMDDTNNADLKRWRIFSDGFNTYATPAGWAYLFANYLASKSPPTIREQAMAIKTIWLKMYNPSYLAGQPSYSTIRACTFRDNASGHIGGAMVLALDNVQLDACRFLDNWSGGPGGAVASSAWNTPVFMSCLFNGNYSINSYSAMSHSHHSRAQIVNCTFTENYSASTNSMTGTAIGNELGAEVKIFNSILWNNSSVATPDGGADIFTTRKADLDDDALARYNESEGAYGDLVAICDIAYSCVQSLESLPEGTDQIPLFYEHRSYSEREIATIQRGLVIADELGALEGHGFMNLGEGNRPGFKTRRGNTSADPLLVDGITPAPVSPVIDAGNSNLFNNGVNGLQSLTGADVNFNERIKGRNVDMGAIENPNAAGSAGIIFVKRDIPGGFRDGKTWDTAFLALKDAMDKALPGMEIWVAAGTYYGGMEGANPDKHLRMRSGIAMYGGFTGTETNRSQRNWQNNPTIISGNVYGNLSPDNYLATLVYNDGNIFGYGCDATAVIDGFILQDAQDSALYNEKASPTIRNCVFRNNRGAFGAGVRSDANSSPRIENCTFYNNSAIGGGAVFGADSSPWLVNCLLYNNKAGKGGAVYGLRSRMRISQSTIVKNAADQDGGGFLTQFGTNEIRNSILWRNTEGQPFAAVTSSQVSAVSSINTITNSSIQGFAPTLGNFHYDPLFAGATTNNFRLTAHSPLLNKGNNAAASGIVSDLDGAARVANSTVDIGAYEYQAVGGMAVEFSSSPESLVTCDVGGTAVFTIESPNVLGHQINWQVDTGSGFASVTTGVTYTIEDSGFGSVLTVHNLATNMNGHQFRYSVTNTAFVAEPITLSVTLPHVIYVKHDAVGIPRNGSSWFNAFTNLQSAMAVAGECSEIWVAQGTYRPDAGSYFTMKRGVGIYGGFAGNESSRTGLVWTVNRTILRGNSANNGVFVNTDPTLRIDADSILEGFVIQNTNTSSAIRNFQASPTIRNCLFETNMGYAISQENSAGSIIGCVFTNGQRSAISVRASTPVISGCRFYGNRDVASAGGINSIYASQFTIENCVFENNTGAIGGGVQVLDGSEVTISRSLFRGNSSQDGGAVHVARSKANLNNLLLLENKAFRGGAVSQNGAELTLNYCTVARNTSGSEAGGVFTYSGTTRIRNSLLWENKDTVAFSTVERAQIDRFSPGTNFVANSVVQGLSTNFAGNGNLQTDPLFVNYAAGNLRLSPYSPSVNAGNAALSSGITTDYAGSSRVFGASADMGAYELQSAASLPPLQLLASPLSSTAYRGAPVFFTLTTLSNGPAITWEVNTGSGYVVVTNGGLFSINTTSNSSTLSISETATNMNGWLFRYSVDGNSFTSSPLNLTVLPAPIVYVRTNAPMGGDGKSWATAFIRLQDALETAPLGAEIWVARGIHRPTTNLYGQIQFAMRPNVSIYGGFAGTETNRSQRNYTANITTLTSSNTPLIVNDPGAKIDATAILDGFTISNVYWFAAINNFNANPTIRNCTFVRNQRFSIYNQSASPLIVNCLFSNNIERCVYNTQSSPTIRDCTFADNGSTTLGGAIYNTESSPLIERCQFNRNASDRGAAVANQLNSSPVIANSAFHFNSSGNGGAIYSSSDSNPTIRNSLFDGNYTTFRGGAIAHYRGMLTVINSTFVNNNADLSGAGIYFQNATGAVHNSIFWKNDVRGTHQPLSKEEQQIDVSQSSVTATYSIVQGLTNFAGNSNSRYEPLFVNPASRDYRLGPYSPAVNTGNDASVSLPDTDVAGNNRKFGTSVDRGAYELQSASSGSVQIVSLPESQTACVGHDVAFTCDAGTNVVIWQRFISGSYTPVYTGATYQLSNVSTGNSAQLRIAIAGTSFTSSPFTLTVNPPTVIYVNINAAPGGNGASWGTALRSFSAALNMADTCSEIWVAKGDYTVTNSLGQPVPFSLKPHIPIYGGFAGTETAVSQRQWWTNVTRLLADSEVLLIANVGYSTPIDSSATLDGFTISGGSDIGTVYNAQASPTFRNCVFTGGRPAVWNSQLSQPIFVNCVFTNNPGGGMYGFGASPIVSNCVFANNTATYGGGMWNTEGNPVFVDSEFRNNSALYGGGLEIDSATNAIIQRCRFIGNSARDGGGLSALLASVKISDSLFVQNHASNRGGGISQYRSDLSIVNCTITENTATDLGGGINYQYENSLTVANSILWNNQDGNTFSTIEDEQAYAPSGSVQQVSYSIIQGLSRFGGNNNVPWNPLFASGAYDLDPTYSPAINAGNNSAVSGAKDLVGANRISGATVDVGALEVQNPTGLQPVRLTRPLSSQVNCEGEAVQFVATGQAGDGTNFQWRVDAGGGYQPIPNDGFHHVTVTSDSAILTVSNLTGSMDGNLYQLVVLNTPFMSLPLTLTVSPPEIIYVDASANGDDNGTSWANAYRSLEPAFARGDSCSEIWIAAGEYTAASLRMKHGLEIYGGFNGTETLRGDRDWIANEVMIKAVPGTATIDNHGSSSIDRSAVLDGVTIVGAAGSSGIDNIGASPTIRSVIFRNHTFWSANNNSSAPLFENCSFLNNSNTPMRNLYSGVVISNCVFENNRSQFSAGMENNLSTVTVVDSEFRSNISQYGGGAINNGNSTALVMNCLFENNSVGMDGGAIANGYNAGVRIVNSVFNGNFARRGGAVASWGKLESINNTVIRNQAEVSASGLYQGDGVGEIYNTILWQNFDTVSRHNFPTVEKAQLQRETGTWSVAYCNIQGLSALAGSGNISFDPLLVNPEAGQYELSAHSPAVNAGNNAHVTGVPLDRNGQTRIQLGTVDIGAHESAASTPSVYLLQTPVSQDVCAGSPVSFAVIATNNIGGDFQWEVDEGGGWIPYVGTVSASGASSTLSIDAADVLMNGYKYRFVLPGVVTGAPALLTVSPAEVIYVNAAAPNGGNGASWITPFNKLQDALAAVQDCRKIVWVAKGTYRPTTGSDPAATFNIPPGASVYGGFFGNEINLNDRDVQANPTILSGDIGTLGATNDNSFYVVVFDGQDTKIDSGTRLDGVIVEGARQAGIETSFASPTIQNCTIRSNQNAGVFVFNGAPIIRKSRLVSNYSSSGGGVKVQSDLIEGDNVTLIQDCEIAGNRASIGGGVCVIGGETRIVNCLIRDNTVTANGGGVATVNGVSTATVVNCTIYNNQALRGGGVGNAGGTVVVRNSILWNNEATIGGATLEQKQIFFQSGIYDVEFSCIAGFSNVVGAGNTGSGPMFVDEDAGDLRLQECSLLIDSGNNLDSIGTNDFGGLNRIANALVDIGAHEFQGAPNSSFDIAGHPVSITYCATGTNEFKVTALGGILVYQWQADYGSGFVDLANDSVYSGVDTDTLTINTPPYSYNGVKYRCAVSGGGCIARSASAILNVPPRLYVNAAVIGGNGLSWTGALQSLQAALTSPLLTSCGAEIWVAEGTYTPTDDSNASSSFHILPHMAVYGGFAGDETDVNQRDIDAHPTILSGAIVSNSSAKVVTIDGNSDPIGNDTILDGFTVTGGDDAGIFVHIADPTIRNCVIAGNTGNGLVLNLDSSAIVDHCRFESNSAVNGAGAWLTGGEPVFSHCTFQGNTASGAGGAFFNQDGSPQFINCLMTGNRSLGAGGGGALGFANGGPVLILNCTIAGNNSTALGAGITANSAGQITIVNSILWRNEANGTNNELAQAYFISATPYDISYSFLEGFNTLSGVAVGDFDPLFVSGIEASDAPTTAGDFHLQQCSPAIDFGDNGALGGLAYDLDGADRAFGGGIVDLGVYEFPGGSLAPLQITTQPNSLSYCPIRGANGFSLAASGSGLTYKWEVDRLNGSGFVVVSNDTKFSGATTTNLVITGPTQDDHGMKFRCLVTSSDGCDVYSKVVTFSYSPVIWYVNSDATGSQTGMSWSNAFVSLSQAMAKLAADEEDRRAAAILAGQPYEEWKLINGPCDSEIWVAEGTYNTANIGLAESVGIYGGFVGTETNRFQRDWIAHPAILNANGANNIIVNKLRTAGGVYTRLGPDSRLDGFTIQGAQGNAIENLQGPEPTYANCIIRSNRRGMFDQFANPAVFDCFFEGNGGPAVEGAAIYHQSGNLLVDRSTFRSNTALNVGALWNESGSLTLLNSVFSGNYAEEDGGAISMTGSGVSGVIRNCTISGNSAGDRYGAISGPSTVMQIFNTIVWSNTANGGYAEGDQFQLGGVDVERQVYNSCIHNMVSTGLANKGNVALNPLFVSPINPANAPSSAGNFRLDPCSPLIDLGSNTWVVTATDRDGLDRISGLGVEMGAYERQVGNFITQQPSNATGSLVDDAIFMVGSGITNASFLWQESTDGGVTFNDLVDGGNYAGVTTAVLTISGASSGFDGSRYRVKVYDGCDKNISSDALFNYVNARPVGNPVAFTNDEDSITYLFLEGYDPEGVSTFGSVIVTDPPHGTLHNIGTDTWNYQPDANYYGSDSFTFTVSDGQTNSLPATVSITLLPVNDQPTSYHNQHVYGFEDVPLNFVFDGGDVDGDPLTLGVWVPLANGTVSSTNEFATYYPATNWSGDDRLGYYFNDGQIDSFFGNVYFHITAVEDPPVANPDYATLYRGLSVTIPILANDSDAESGVSLVAFSQGTHGTVVSNGSSLVYTHDGSFTTSDLLNYQIKDTANNVVFGQVFITIKTNLQYLVTTNSDSGAGSLREALEEANMFAGTNLFPITFSPNLSGRTILLNSIGDANFGESAFVISSRVTIDAASAPLLTIARSANVTMRLFRVTDSGSLTIRNLSLQNGLARGDDGDLGARGSGGGGGGFGGAIYSEGQLSISKVHFAGNEARGGDGGGFAVVFSSNGGGMNGGIAPSGAGGFGGGGAGAGSFADNAPGAPGGFGGGQGGGQPGPGVSGGLGGFGGGGGGSSSPNIPFSGGGGLGAGGAIFNRGGYAFITNCTFAGNIATGGLGGQIVGPPFNGLDGFGYGAAFFNYNGTAVVMTCSFATNIADDGDGIYNVGDDAGAYVTMFRVTMTNAPDRTNFVQAALGGGTAGALRDNVSTFTQAEPSLSTIPNQSSIGPVLVPFIMAPPSGVDSASCSDTAVVVSVSTTGVDSNRVITIIPVLGSAGTAQVFAAVSSGNVSMAEVFRYSLSRSLNALVIFGHTTTVQVLETNLGWSIVGALPGAYGNATYDEGSLTYVHSGVAGASDVIKFLVTDGVGTVTNTLNVTILPNGIPVADNQFVYSLPGESVSFTLTATDPENDPIGFEVLSLPASGTLLGTSPNLEFMASEPGFYTFEFRAYDPFDYSGPATVTLVVRDTAFVQVTSLLDSGPGSLRDALSQANADPAHVTRITFEPSLATQRIDLVSVGDDAFGPSALVVSNIIIIDGESNKVEIARDSFAAEMRLIRICSNAYLALRNVKLIGGVARGEDGGTGVGGGGGGAGLGGGIFNEGTLLLESVTLQSNKSFGGSSGLFDGEYSSPGGDGGDPNGGIGGPSGSSGTSGGFGGGGGGSGSGTFLGRAGAGGYGAGNGGDAQPGTWDVTGGDGGFGGGGGGGWPYGGGGGLGAGGALFNNVGDVTIRSCVFTNNSATGGDGHRFESGGGGDDGEGYGAAIFGRNGSLDIVDALIANSEPSSTYGGAIYTLGDGIGATSALNYARIRITNTEDFADIIAKVANGGKMFTLRDNASEAFQLEPWIYYIDDVSILEPTNSLSFTFYYAIPFMGGGYAFSAKSDNHSLVPDTNIAMNSINSFQGTMTITPVPGQMDQAEITAYLANGDQSFGQRFLFTVGLFAEQSMRNGKSVIQFSSPTNRTYSVQSATSLLPANWTTIGTGTQIRSGRYEFYDSGATTNQLFYRITSP